MEGSAFFDIAIEMSRIKTPFEMQKLGQIRNNLRVRQGRPHF